MIDVEELLESAVGEPAAVDIGVVQGRVDQRRRRRRGVWVICVVALVLAVPSAVRVLGESSPEEVTTAGPDATGVSPSVPDAREAPEGWANVTFRALHVGEEVVGPVTLWVWVEPEGDADLSPYTESGWMALYQRVELVAGNAGTVEVGADLYNSLITAVVPAEVVQKLAEWDERFEWMAVTPQPAENPGPCSPDADEPSCPHPPFSPPGYETEPVTDEQAAGRR